MAISVLGACKGSGTASTDSAMVADGPLETAAQAADAAIGNGGAGGSIVVGQGGTSAGGVSGRGGLATGGGTVGTGGVGTGGGISTGGVTGSGGDTALVCPDSSQFVGNPSWPDPLVVTTGAKYCGTFKEIRNLEQELAAKAKLTIAAGTYRLANTPGRWAARP